MIFASRATCLQNAKSMLSWMQEIFEGRGNLQKAYSEKMCDSVLKYFASYIGFWERKMQEIDKRIPGTDSQARAKRNAEYEALMNEQAATARLRGVPSLEKWAKLVKVNPSTVSRWRKEYPEFDDACRDCMAIQTDILRDGGLGGLYSSRVGRVLIKMNEDRMLQDEERQIEGMRLEDFDDEADDAVNLA
jgi:hypothetical protein